MNSEDQPEMLRYEVRTTVTKDGRITQDLDFVHGDIRELLLRRVIDTQERTLREALVALGWTPPKVVNEQ